MCRLMQWCGWCHWLVSRVRRFSICVFGRCESDLNLICCSHLLESAAKSTEFNMTQYFRLYWCWGLEILIVFVFSSLCNYHVFFPLWAFLCVCVCVAPCTIAVLLSVGWVCCWFHSVHWTSVESDQWHLSLSFSILRCFLWCRLMM